MRDALDLLRKISLVDWALLFVLPFVITVTALLPESAQSQLRLNVQDPKFWQYFTSNFVHQNFSLYVDNLIPFLIYGLLQLLLMARVREQKHYFRMLFVSAAAIPLVFTALRFSLPVMFLRAKYQVSGFSGIASAVIGMTPLILVYSFSRNREGSLVGWRFLGLISSSFALSLALVYIKLVPITSLLMVVALVGFMLFLCRDSLKRLFRLVLAEFRSAFTYYLLVLTLLFVALGPNLMFPAAVGNGGSATDIGAHYLGLVGGAFASFVFLYDWKLFEKRMKGN